MKLHIITIGQPKLAYARVGWQDYTKRLSRFHTVRSSHLSDRHASDSRHILATAGNSYKVVLEITGKGYNSQQLAQLLDTLAVEAREVSFIIGGPDGLPQPVIDSADLLWSLSALTLPHDLAMVIVAESLYRASTINAGHPYHRA